MIPSSSNYPDAFDTNVNLFLAHDALRVTLVEDYNPGDTSITVSGDIMGRFPLTGFITLTEQCSELENRAINFFYGSRTLTTFDELEIVSGFPNVSKPKLITNVTQNVVAEHHNSLKDALIAIEEFVGIQGTIDTHPLGSTMEGRINYLRALVLRPRAWFSVNKRIGVVPMRVKFSDLSFRNPTSFLWDFGDNTTSTTTVSATTEAPNISNILVNDLDGGDIEKVYHNPGIYSVSLTVSNEFGEDTVVLPDIVNARIAAPDDAVISVTPDSNQTVTAISPIDEPYLYVHLLPGIINARTNTLIHLAVTDAGEQAGDPVVSYTWKLSDDLTHQSAITTNASYSIGGYYDIKLRVDTQFGSYRITTLEDGLNVIERENLFLLNFDSSSISSAITKNVTAYEFGLVSETFKTKNRSSQSITKDYRFLDGSIPEYEQQKREFLANQNTAQRGSTFSGDNGTMIVYWSEGAAASTPLSSQTVRFMEYEGFTDLWRSPASFAISRPWNWVGLNSPNSIFLLFGVHPSAPVGTSPTNPQKTAVSYLDLSVTNTVLDTSVFTNGADELLTNVGNGSDGDFSVYRSCYKDSNGFIMRNDGVGVYFRLKSFYRTDGTTLNPINIIRKLADIPGTAKTEGQIVALSNGVYFFNNSGELAVYDTVGNAWQVGGPGPGSVSFRSLQDSTVSDFDDQSNTLIAVSDADRRAYLSYNYSTKAFIKFTESDFAFVSLPERPSGMQFTSGVF